MIEETEKDKEILELKAEVKLQKERVNRLWKEMNEMIDKHFGGATA